MQPPVWQEERGHELITLTKEVGLSSAKLLSALVNTYFSVDGIRSFFNSQPFVDSSLPLLITT
jgi:hypothetical protein